MPGLPATDSSKLTHCKPPAGHDVRHALVDLHRHLTVLTTVFTGYFVLPRMESHNRRHQAADQQRDQFGESVFTILAACEKLRVMPEPPAES